MALLQLSLYIYSDQEHLPCVPLSLCVESSVRAVLGKVGRLDESSRVNFGYMEPASGRSATKILETTLFSLLLLYPARCQVKRWSDSDLELGSRWNYSGWGTRNRRMKMMRIIISPLTLFLFPRSIWLRQDGMTLWYPLTLDLHVLLD